MPILAQKKREKTYPAGIPIFALKGRKKREQLYA